MLKTNKGTPLIVHDDKSTPEIRGVRLKRLRKMANLTRKEVEVKYSINSNTMKGWELGRHGGLTEKGAKKVLEMFYAEGISCEINWLLYGLGEDPKVSFKKDMPLEKKLSYTTSTAEEEKQIINELLLFRQYYKDILEYIVCDDGMEPFFMNDDYVAGVRYHNEDIKKLVGLNCIIKIDNKTLLRNLREGSKENLYKLVCLNTQTNLSEPVLYDVKIDSAAPIIWLRRKNYLIS